MIAWDYLIPHRLQINKSLRKASQELRDKIDLCQIEYSRRLEDCQAEIKRAEEDKKTELEVFRAALFQELSADHQTLKQIQDSIIEYLECYFSRAYLYRLIDLNKRKNDIYNEDISFLNQEIKSIDNEVVLLRERQNELTAFSKVDDIIRLTTLTGNDLGFQTTDDARQLLGKISTALESYIGDDRVEKYALLRLKTIIQERSEYLPSISYITWVIQIKRRYRKQLASKCSDVKRKQAILHQEMASIKNEIQALTDRLGLAAEKVRYYWAKPITYLNADICYAYIELNEAIERLNNYAPALRRERKELIENKRSAITEIQNKKSRRRDVGSELRSMRDSRSSDQWQWDSLQKERKRLASDIDLLSAEIDRYSSRIDSLSSEIEILESAVKTCKTTVSSKKDARKRWSEKRDQIVEFLKRYDKKFRCDRRIAEKDEMSIITTRLEEIQLIREEDAVEAQEVYKQEYEDIIRRHKEKVSCFEDRKKILLERCQEAKAVCSTCEQRVSLAERQLASSKEADSRFVLLRFFTQSCDVTVARDELERAHAALANAKETKSSIESMIDELMKESEAEAKAFDEEIHNCKPRHLRPTSAEQHEEKKLLLRRVEMSQQHKEGGHESKS